MSEGFNVPVGIVIDVFAEYGNVLCIMEICLMRMHGVHNPTLERAMIDTALYAHEQRCMKATGAIVARLDWEHKSPGFSKRPHIHADVKLAVAEALRLKAEKGGTFQVYAPIWRTV